MGSVAAFLILCLNQWQWNPNEIPMSSSVESSLRCEKCINNNNGPGKQYITFFIELLYTRLQANTAIVPGDVQTTGTFVAEELFQFVS